ncbi:MAG: DJ-1/PfpI family protein [Thermovirgaceae bacterium]|nr:DJ-1/PfpI family protein [Thermovirgaceae bacterium]
MPKKGVFILIFDDVEVLDFAGPFEVFSVTDELNSHALFDIKTVSPMGETITAKNGLSVNPDRTIPEVKSADILIVPGGWGVRALLNQDDVTGWIGSMAKTAELVLSVCTGSMLLARAGLLKGLRATTHHSVMDEFAAMSPETEIERGERFVDNGKVITAAGISAAMDMSLYVVERLFGRETADRTAAYMEYRIESTTTRTSLVACD